MTLLISGTTSKAASRASELLSPRLEIEMLASFLKICVLLNWYRTRNRLAFLFLSSE